MSILFIILAVLVLLVLWAIGVRNSLVRSKAKVDNSFSQIDIQLQRRFDLIPNLVECVKGYMAHEEGVLTKVTELRTAWAKASTPSEKMNIDNELSGALKTIMAVSENYPDLKANTNFSELQSELKDTENKISFARQFYNDTVTRYNTELLTFPNNLVASIFGFTAATLFQVDSAEARQAVKVDFNK